MIEHDQKIAQRLNDNKPLSPALEDALTKLCRKCDCMSIPKAPAMAAFIQMALTPVSQATLLADVRNEEPESLPNEEKIEPAEKPVFIWRRTHGRNKNIARKCIKLDQITFNRTNIKFLDGDCEESACYLKQLTPIGED